MKTFISIFAVILALAFTGPAFAGMAKTAKTESDCRMADGHWDKMTKTCKEKRCKPKLTNPTDIPTAPGSPLGLGKPGLLGGSPLTNRISLQTTAPPPAVCPAADPTIRTN